MKQPSVYSHEQIIEAAVDLIRETGWSSVTARAIAGKLGSSTMPIYSNVKSMEDLGKEVWKKARQLLIQYQQQQYTDFVLLNLAFGYVKFARDEKQLFRFLYLEEPKQLDLENSTTMKDSFFSDFGEDSEAGIELLKLKTTGQEPLIQYTWIFTHGLAMLVNSGSSGINSDQAILKYLKNAGEAFYLWSMKKDTDPDNEV